MCDNAKSCRNVTCNEDAECVEINGVAACKCIEGFQGNGQYCDPIIDQSCHIANNCSPFGYCSINPSNGIYNCSCLPGYTGDGYKCTEIETTTESITTEEIPTVSDRRVEQICSPEGCWCPVGYQRETDTEYCIPDEDSTQPGFIKTTTQGPSQPGFIPTTIQYAEETCDIRNNCHPDATCSYSDLRHAYECVCNEGFEGTGYFCDPEVVSCTKVDNCDPQATCTYDESLGKSKCICNSGFQGDGFTCTLAIAACSSNQDCTSTEECIFTSSQQYECICKEGYVRDSQNQCVLVVGSCGGGKCVENAECLYDEEYQTFYCTCKEGYVGNGITECREKIIGCDTLNNCGAHATCLYLEEELSYKCVCNQGFFGDGLQCYAEKNCHIDPSMCDAHAACLTDANRQFICRCNTGYIGNGTVCKEIFRNDGTFLLLNQGMATLRIPLDKSKSSVRRPIQVKAFQTAVGLDVDCLTGRVYWSDISGRAIRSAFVNGSGKVDFITKGIGSPEGLAIDWVSRNIYWTDSTLDTIEVANLDSKLRKTLFFGDLVNPRGIAVHPQRGKIFWTDWNRKNPKIEWANADGTDRQIFSRGEINSLPNSLTIDYETEQLCYADAGIKTIECIQIDTGIKQTVALNCTYPFGITATDKYIYWSDWISKKIESADKFTLRRQPAIPVPLGGSGNKLFALVAVANSCPSLTNVCEYNRNQCPAEHICLPNGLGGRQCLCGYKADSNETPSCNL
ncbi:hypothetical protein JTB14_008256 [Gonioctena quinquepunctata]|nr:hypothetical protein JTB14_008256 [Gonioctena quinquepunctata]